MSRERDDDNEGRVLSRRDLIRLSAVAGMTAAIGSRMDAQSRSIIERVIPSTGERIPAVGLGTWQTFDVGPSAIERTPLARVMDAFAREGGRVIDSSPMYGRAEQVTGDLVGQVNETQDGNARFFLATKVWTTGRKAGVDQMERSMRLLRTTRLDLMQVHNLVDAETHLQTLREWKAAGRVRHVGITHYHSGAYAGVERFLSREPLDVLQINYSLAERDAERRVLPLAQQRGVAVVINRPFAEGELFRRVRGHTVPSWAIEFDCTTWAQFFLKFILSHPAVTAVIPATSNVDHLRDNMLAGRGRLPDEAARRRMIEHLERL
jgi:aryl-alcohol dehydrogenase-like predicted oxidoreductase